MFRADPATERDGQVRGTRLLSVAAGEAKVACGADVTIETAALERVIALAVFDPKARVGGIAVVGDAGASGEANEAREALSAACQSLRRSVIRMGGDAGRLSFVTAGGGDMLAALLGPRAAGAARPRRSCGPSVGKLVLSLGEGAARLV